jgi:hypothetical protein
VGIATRRRRRSDSLFVLSFSLFFPRIAYIYLIN